MGARLYRVILPVADIERAAAFYGAVFDQPGSRVSPGRHYFGCEGVILACYDPVADGDGGQAVPNPDHVYFAVPDLEAFYTRIFTLGSALIREPIETKPWGERSFYCVDPFGNKLCFVDETTLFTAGLI